MLRRTALVALVALATAGCGQFATRTPSSPSAVSGTGYRLFLAEGIGYGRGHIAVRDARTGRLERSLPDGTPAPDWSRYYWVSQLGGSAQITAAEPASGRVLARATIPGGFQFPMFEPAVTAGISPNGQWLVLYRQDRASGAVISRFLIGNSSLSQPFTAATVSGNFDFDAISDDGSSLYLIQSLDDQGHYQVRLYDLAAHLLSPQVIVDKREPNEPMNGVRGDSVTADQLGYVLTVYARENGPFIHALPLNHPFAWCVDLPNSGSSGMEDQFHWSLAVSRDASRLYAVNPAIGSIAELSLATQTTPPAMVRTTQIDVQAPSALSPSVITDAEAKEAPIGGSALSPDDQTLFAVGTKGILAIDTQSLRVRARYLADQVVASLRLSPDGQSIYAASPTAGTVWQLDARSGSIASKLTGITNPWAVLWVESE
jgi:hypothetical protein